MRLNQAIECFDILGDFGDIAQEGGDFERDLR